MLGVTTTALTLGLAGCGSSTAELPPKPTDQACDDWDWDDDQGVWICDDQQFKSPWLLLLWWSLL